MAVYLAADEAPPLVAWDEARPAFYVTKLSGEPDDSVRRQFSKPHVVYLGSHEGCGCGFDYGTRPDLSKPEEEQVASRKSLAALVEYVGRLLDRLGAVELFACWEGDQGKAPLSRGNMKLSEIGGESFCFRERELLHLVK